MKKSLCTIFTAGLMAALTVFPSFALEYQYDTGSTEIFTNHLGYRWASGHKDELPGWGWIDGYCYYFKDQNANIQKGGVTPDGYTVDEEGRWTVDGVPQYNGYGTYVMGTDELYAGKNDDERWAVMKDQLEQLFANYTPGSDYALAMMSTNDGVFCGWTKDGGCTHYISHNSQADYSYINASIANIWNDNPGEWGSYKTDKIEKMIKLVCGDHVGQELFNDIKAAADPCEGGPREVYPVDENGNFIFLDENHVYYEIEPISSDGVNFNYFDLNKWSDRTTDYGKKMKVLPVDPITHAWSIVVEK